MRRSSREIVTVVGGGYVGLPMAVLCASRGMDVTILEKDPHKVLSIIGGRSYLGDVPSEFVAAQVDVQNLSATLDPAEAHANASVVLICVPTPMQLVHEPDLSFVNSAIDELLPHLEEGTLVALESTVYPGYTREVLCERLRKAGFEPGENVFVSFSPERVDPTNKVWHTSNTPKVVGGRTPACAERAREFYSKIVNEVVLVDGTDTAELVKLLENTFRAVNIALVNELAIQCSLLGINVWDVVDAAATKPFGFLSFKPGPGCGGHCIKPDPQYLVWKLRTLGYESQLAGVASRVNASMPSFVVARLREELREQGQPLLGARVLAVGLAYKANVSDTRESPSLDVVELLKLEGVEVSFLDDLVALEPPRTTRVAGTCNFGVFDAAVILTDHTDVDYQRLAGECPLVLDTRGVLRRLGVKGRNVVEL